MPAGALPLDPSRGSAPLSTTFLFRKRNNENFERDVARPDIISFEVEPLTKRSQGKALLSAAPLAPREKSEIFPAGTPYEIAECRTEGIAIVTRSVNRVGLTKRALAMRHSLREAGALQAA